MNINRFFIESENDSIFLSDNIIHLFINNSERFCNLSSIKKMQIHSICTAQNCLVKYLVLCTYNYTEIFINFNHICFTPFFQQLCSVFSLRNNKLADAIACTQNGIFEIYPSFFNRFKNYRSFFNRFEIYPSFFNRYSLSALLIFIITTPIVHNTYLKFIILSNTILLIACGINIAGFVLAIIAYIKNTRNSLVGGIIIIYLASYMYLIPTLILFQLSKYCANLP